MLLHCYFLIHNIPELSSSAGKSCRLCKAVRFVGGLAAAVAGDTPSEPLVHFVRFLLVLENLL